MKLLYFATLCRQLTRSSIAFLSSRFVDRVMPACKINQNIGNCYTGSVFSSLLSVLAMRVQCTACGMMTVTLYNMTYYLFCFSNIFMIVSSFI